MGNKRHGDPGVGQALDYLQNLFYHLRIQCAGRLIEQHNLRLHGQRPRDGYTLLLSSGKLARIHVCLLGQADQL